MTWWNNIGLTKFTTSFKGNNHTQQTLPDIKPLSKILFAKEVWEMNLSMCLDCEGFSWMYYSGTELLDTFNILRDLQKWWNCNPHFPEFTSSNIQCFCATVCVWAVINLLLTEDTCSTCLLNQFCRPWACCEWSMISFWLEWRALWACQVVSVCLCVCACAHISIWACVFVIEHSKC